jgi:DNA repair exonuclease SbcCD ATPase subunit
VPTATDEKLGEQIHGVAESLVGFRLEMAERFAAFEKTLEGVLSGFRLETAERFGSLEKTFEGFRNKVETHLQFIKWLGVFFAGILVAVVVGSGRVVWDAATVSSDVKQQGRVLETLASEVKQQGRVLETLGSEVKQQGRVLETLISQVKQQGTRLEQQGRVLETLGSEFKQQGTRLDKVEGRLDAVQKQLEILISRSAPKVGG